MKKNIKLLLIGGSILIASLSMCNKASALKVTFNCTGNQNVVCATISNGGDVVDYHGDKGTVKIELLSRTSEKN